MLRLLKEAFSNLSQSKVLEDFFLYFFPSVATLVASLGPSLGGRLAVPWEWKAQLGELNATCNSLSFLEA